jgi:hypothetical protein
MKKSLVIFLLLSGFSCNPYPRYYFTHYHITAGYDPASTFLSANVHMVFVPQQEYHDSITFQLNDLVEVQSLASQELKYYEFDNGRLVLYIEEAVVPGDQIHISMTYKGPIGAGPDTGNMLTPDKQWYPVNSDITNLTCSIELDLPEQYRLEEPWIRKGHSWHWGTKIPVGSITLPPITE